MVGINRRHLMLGAAAVGAAVLVGRNWSGPGLSFDTTGVPQGFRRLVLADNRLSSALQGVTLAGAAERLAPAKLCALTFRGAPGGQGRLSIAVFSDYFCPYCRILDPQVEELAAANPQITLIRHEIPLLGPASDMAARAAVAAAQQGGGASFRQRLMRTSFVPNHAYLRSVADAEGLKPDRLIADLTAASTDVALAQSRAAFRAFGFPGTPGMVVGGTVVSGTVPGRKLRQLIDLEIAAPAPCAAVP